MRTADFLPHLNGQKESHTCLEWDLNRRASRFLLTNYRIVSRRRPCCLQQALRGFEGPAHSKQT